MRARLTEREVAVRAAAVAALAGLALVQVVELPATVAQAPHLGAPAVLAAAACLALAAVVAAASRAPWPGVALAGGLAMGGWLATRAVAIPGLEQGTGAWMTVPGLASAALGGACLVLAAAGSPARSPRALAAAVATTAAVVAALAPAAGALLVALAPGPVGGETTISEGAPGDVHVHAEGGAAAGFHPGFGGHSGHYVYPNATLPHLPSWGLAVAVGLAAAVTYLAAGMLRRRREAPAVEREVVIARSVPA